MENSEREEIGPSKISFPTFLLKIIAGSVGGTVGTLVYLVIYLLVGTLVQEGSLTAEYISPIFIFLLLIMSFLASTTGNILSTLLLSLTEKDKYTKKSTTIYQIFIVSIIIFLLMAPVYFLAASINVSFVAYAVALHVLVSAQLSALIMEIVSNNKYALVGVYGVTFSIITSAIVLTALSALIASPALLLFIGMPVVWATIAAVSCIVSMIYGWLVRIYDKDFLAAETVYGDDYAEEDTSPEETPKIVDTDGADFLRKA